jgi:hypothetical protein
MAVTARVFWDVKPYSLAESTNAPRKPAVSIFFKPDRGRRDTGLEAVRIKILLMLPHKYWQNEIPSNTAKSDTPWLMEITIQATILSASNLFYLRSTDYYFHIHSPLEFLFQPHSHAARNYLKFGHHDANTTEGHTDKNGNCDV